VIDFHYVGTSNGRKVAIMLEETALPYRVIEYPLYAGHHLTPAFGRLNPNHKLPVIVDHAPDDGGEPFAVFESGAILQYLADKTGRFLPTDARGRSLVLQWLTWQVAGLGPMHGQAHHFVRYAPDGQDYAVDRYSREARRLLHVLERRLGEVEGMAGDYLAGDYSIADMACWPWVLGIALIGIDIEEFPAIARWSARMAARPAVAATANSDQLRLPTAYRGKRMALSPEEWSNLFGDRLYDAVKVKVEVKGGI
jgi:GST-like protein